MSKGLGHERQRGKCEQSKIIGHQLVHSRSVPDEMNGVSAGASSKFAQQKFNVVACTLAQRRKAAIQEGVKKFHICLSITQKHCVILHVLPVLECNSLQHVVQQYLWLVSPRCISMKFVLPNVWCVGLPCVWAFTLHNSRSTGAATVSLCKCICCMAQDIERPTLCLSWSHPESSHNTSVVNTTPKTP